MKVVCGGGGEQEGQDHSVKDSFVTPALSKALAEESKLSCDVSCGDVSSFSSLSDSVDDILEMPGGSIVSEQDNDSLRVTERDETVETVETVEEVEALELMDVDEPMLPLKLLIEFDRCNSASAAKASALKPEDSRLDTSGGATCSTAG